VLDFCVLFLCGIFLPAAHLIRLAACINYRDVSHGIYYLAYIIYCEAYFIERLA
jgi:hypothetical protein